MFMLKTILQCSQRERERFLLYGGWEEMCAQPGQLFSLQGIRMLSAVLLTQFPTNYLPREREETGGTVC